MQAERKSSTSTLKPDLDNANVGIKYRIYCGQTRLGLSVFHFNVIIMMRFCCKKYSAER